MKNNIKTVLILLLALVVLASLVVVAACDKNKEPTTVTLTVDYGLEGVPNDTITVDIGKPFADKLTPPTSELTFGGWYLGDDQVTSSTVAPNTDFTVKAKWIVTYRVEYYLEKLEVTGEFELATDLTVDNFSDLGATVTAEIKDVRGFDFDENNANNVKTATLKANGTTLKLYYTRSTVTITFDKLIGSASGTMTAMVGRYGATVKLTACGFTSDFTFVGWNTAANGTGTDIKDGANLTLSSDVTLYAQWQTTYTVNVYVEKDVTDETKTEGAEYAQQPATTANGIIGRTVTAAAENPNSAKYALNATLSKTTGVVSEQGLTLELYFSLRAFAVRYMDDDTVEYVKYGADYTVRTPKNGDPNYRIISYCDSASGNGTDYPFEKVIKNVTADITLYPVIIDIYADAADSGDVLEIQRNRSDYGSAKLILDGTEYLGRVTSENGILSFEIEVEGVTRYGRPYVDGGKNLFRYRGEEYGTYLFYDYIFGGGVAYDNVMLALDGYGTGVYSMPADDGTERLINFYVVYKFSEEDGDYYMQYFNPASPNEIYEEFFTIVKHSYEGLEEIAGYFMLWNFDNEYGEYVWLDNQQLYPVHMFLDGYGNAIVYTLGDNGEVKTSVTGTYYASNDYVMHAGDPSYLEYVFVSTNEESFPTCYFTITYISYGGSSRYVFLTKNAEYGVYTVEGASFPELYLDGYGGALYSTDADDAGRLGSYTIKSQNADGTYTVVIRFVDATGGVMVVDIRIDRQENGMSYGVLTAYKGQFIIDDEGVLTEYVYDPDIGPDSVIIIPEGVIKIAEGVFSGISITSVTFPTTLEEIGDYAFSNGDMSGGTSLRTVIFLGANPPTLGLDVFRWVKGANFKIIVPDGAEEDYRKAESWIKNEASLNGGYAQFVTTAQELANKPEFEIRDGVLISYNNKKENPHEEEITIPDEVTEIAYGVFAGLTYIKSVNLNNVTKIGANAFYGCYYITSVTFNPNTESIGERAFYECINIKEVDLGQIREIGAEAFSRCLSLAKVTIGSSLTYIGERAFYECSRDESYGYNPDGELEEKVEIHDLIITIAATTAPTMGMYVFQGSQPRLYVNDYQTAVGFAVADSWTTYARYLRVKAEGEQQTWYSKSNANGWVLTLGDRLLFDDTYTAFYKWDGTTLYVTWFIYSEIANRITLYEQVAHVVNGELVGLDLSWDGGSSYTFVPVGTTLSYTGNSGETLQLTVGNDTALFNGSEVQIVMYGYSMRFEYDGYLYTVTLYDDSNNLTFSYTRSKVIVVKEYTAEDGSTLTIYFGDSITANGRLEHVNGTFIYTETRSWILKQAAENIYTFLWNHKTGNYSVVITILDDTTFKYEWSIASVVTVYRNAETGHVAIVTVPNNPEEKTTIRIMFKTSNGTDEQRAEILSANGNVFTIKIDGTVEVDNPDGDNYDVPSTFNGTYTLTLIPDATNPTFELVKLQ